MLAIIVFCFFLLHSLRISTLCRYILFSYCRFTVNVQPNCSHVIYYFKHLYKVALMFHFLLKMLL